MALVPSTSVGGSSSGAGASLGYDQITANVTVSSTTESAGTTVISCAAHTFDGNPVIVSFFANEAACGSGTTMTISLFEGATQITELVNIAPGTGVANNGVPVFAQYVFTPTAASHTYTVTAFRGSGSNGTIVAGSGGTGGISPCFIRFQSV